MPEMPEIGLREVDPGNREYACCQVTNLLECTRREINGVYVWAGRTVVTARQRQDHSWMWRNGDLHYRDLYRLLVVGVGDAHPTATFARFL